MTNDEISRWIAERVMEWHVEPSGDTDWYFDGKGHCKIRVVLYHPASDLNQLHEALGRLSFAQRWILVRRLELEPSCPNYPSAQIQWWFLNAPADIRARALVEATGGKL